MIDKTGSWALTAFPVLRGRYPRLALTNVYAKEFTRVQPCLS